MLLVAVLLPLSTLLCPNIFRQHNVYSFKTYNLTKKYCKCRHTNIATLLSLSLVSCQSRSEVLFVCDCSWLYRSETEKVNLLALCLCGEIFVRLGIVYTLQVQRRALFVDCGPSSVLMFGCRSTLFFGMSDYLHSTTVHVLIFLFHLYMFCVCYLIIGTIISVCLALLWSVHQPLFFLCCVVLKVCTLILTLCWVSICDPKFLFC